MKILNEDEKVHLAAKQDEGYAAYMRAFYEVVWNKMLIPVWVCKDNLSLFIRVFLSVMMFLILMEYINMIYAEWEAGTQAGQAAYLLIKVWFSYMIFKFAYPSGIVERAQESAARLQELWETKSWIKKPALSESEHLSQTSKDEQSNQ